jgi:hypothetical protein
LALQVRKVKRALKELRDPSVLEASQERQAQGDFRVFLVYLAQMELKGRKVSKEQLESKVCLGQSDHKGPSDSEENRDLQGRRD